MTIAALRNKLTDYLQVADDKKIRAIYTILEHDMELALPWYEQKAVVDRLNAEFSDWKDGKAKGYNLDEIKGSIDELRLKRNK